MMIPSESRCLRAWPDCLPGLSCTISTLGAGHSRHIAPQDWAPTTPLHPDSRASEPGNGLRGLGQPRRNGTRHDRAGIPRRASREPGRMVRMRTANGQRPGDASGKAPTRLDATGPTARRRERRGPKSDASLWAQTTPARPRRLKTCSASRRCVRTRRCDAFSGITAGVFARWGSAPQSTLCASRVTAPATLDPNMTGSLWSASASTTRSARERAWSATVALSTEGTTESRSP